MDFEIRKASVKDSDKIINLIKELAVYEDLLSEVKVSKKLLEENLFSKHSSAEVLLAHKEDDFLGYSLYFRSFSSFLGRPGIYLEDLYVRKGFRGNGIGKALLCRVAKKTIEIGGKRLDWSVLNWNRNAIAFYEKIGAKPLRKWTTYRISDIDLKRLSEI